MTEKTADKETAADSKYSEHQRRVNSISWMGILVLIIIVVIAICIFIYVFVRQQVESRTKSQVGSSDGSRDRYFLIWGDDFSRGTDPDNVTMPDPDHGNDIYPDLNRWTLQQGGYDKIDDTYFTYSTRNASINCRENGDNLRVRLLPERTTIINSEGYRRYSYTSARIVSRVAAVNGFFNLRFRPPPISGLRVKISLLPFVNSGMNVIGSTYGPWPLCGEIVILDLNTTDRQWRGYLTYGNILRQPKANVIRRLSLDQWQIIGLEWTDQCITWIYNGSVNDGKVKGDRVQTVTHSDWYTMEPSKYGDRRIPAPAPFDQPFQLVIELSKIDEHTNQTDDETHEREERYDKDDDNGNEEKWIGEMLMDWVKLYGVPSSDLSVASVNRELYL